MKSHMIKYLPILCAFAVLPPTVAANSYGSTSLSPSVASDLLLARNGADDAAGHDAADDRGRGRDGREVERGGESLKVARHGEDDGAGHDVGDVRGQGADDPVGHDAGDDRGHDDHGRDERGVFKTEVRVQQARRGADDPVGHNAADDHGRNRG